MSFVNYISTVISPHCRLLLLHSYKTECTVVCKGIKTSASLWQGSLLDIFFVILRLNS